MTPFSSSSLTSVSPEMSSRLLPAMKLEIVSSDCSRLACRTVGNLTTLLPGIPDHITMYCIFLKLKWQTWNALLMVNQGWQSVIGSRRVYEARVLSHSTEPFLVLISVEDDGKFVATLYSCEYDYVLQLPPLPSDHRFLLDECICMGGKVYLWVKREEELQSTKEVFVWVLDLAGDRKWKQGEHHYFMTDEPKFDYGVLDGQIYKFRGSTHSERGVLNGAKPFGSYVEFVAPQAEVYDPLSDEWTLITPRPGQGYMYHDITAILNYSTDKFGEDHRKGFCKVGWYEPFFSEWRWRRKHCSTPETATDADSHNESQVYYKNTIYDFYDEHIFFFGRKLAKFTKDMTAVNAVVNDSIIKIEMFDTQKNTWNHWKSFSFNFHLPWGGIFWMVDFASTDNVIWAIMAVEYRPGKKVEYILLRSPVILDEDKDALVSLVPWIDTGHCLADKDAICTGHCTVRPIYV